MNPSRVVVGVDGSPLSQAAVAQAAHFASSRGMGLHVLHAFASDLPMLGFGALEDRSVLTDHGHRLVAAAAAQAHAAHPALDVTTSCHDGFASEALVSASRTAALVVLGAMGHGILSRAGVGAVAMQVVTHARCPVLVVGHETTGEPVPGGRVVAGVDLSEESLRALGVAFREAALTASHLEVVNVWQARSPQDPTLAQRSSWEDYAGHLEDAVEEALAGERVGHREVKVETLVVRGEPAEALVARSEGANLLVVASRGSGGFPGLHVGSTALRLMGHSACPVLVTR